MQALENANQVTQQIIALQADECKQAELEEWLDQLRTEVEDSVDKAEEYLERRAGAPLSVIGDFAADNASEIDDKTSQTSRIVWYFTSFESGRRATSGGSCTYGRGSCIKG